MDLAKVLQQLHEELENLNAAISSLERLQEAGKNRGKDQWLGDIAVPVPPVRKPKGKTKSKDGGAPKSEPGTADTNSGE
jgi:hypothetical protein